MTDRALPVAPFDILVFLRGALWRPWLTALVTVTGTLIAVLAASMMPPVFQSSARILVESQQIPDALARSTVTASAAERLAVIEQRLMTRENLLDLSRRLDLFAAQPDLTPTERVEILRKATQIQSITFDPTPRRRGTSKLSAFTISFETGIARQAARVTNEFVNMILEQNLAARVARASETHDFFRAEVERLAVELGEAEAAIAGFKTANQSYLPAGLKPKLSELNMLRQRQQGRAERILRLVQEAERTTEIEPDSTTGFPLNAPGAGSGGETVTPATLSFGLRKQSQLDLLETQQIATRARIAEVEAAVDRTNRVEMELSALQRRFDQLQTQHREAVRKQNEAATGEKLEDSRQAERFEVIEHAHVPEHPIAPRREFVAMGGALASFSLAVTLAGLLEWMSRTVRTAGDLQRMLNVRPILVVPRMPTRRERTMVHLRRILSGAVLVAGALGVLAGIHIFVTPLDMLAHDWLRQSGMRDVIAYLLRII